jgi:hypothetical protein
MNRYILIRRLRGPAYLLLVGFIALMAQAHIMSWGHSWPLFLILAGVLALAERAALAAEGDPPPTPYAGGPYPGVPYQGGPYTGGPNPPGAPSGPTTPSSSIVPAHSDDFERGSDGGQS